MHTGYASIAVDASSSAASAAAQSQDDAWRPQHPQRCTAAPETPPQAARRKDANSPTSVIDARDDKQLAPLGAAQNHAVARAALLGVALTLGVLLVLLLASTLASVGFAAAVLAREVRRDWRQPKLRYAGTRGLVELPLYQGKSHHVFISHV